MVREKKFAWVTSVVNMLTDSEIGQKVASRAYLCATTAMWCVCESPV